MTILEKIISSKKKLVQEAKDLYPLKLLQESQHYSVTPVSMCKYLQRSDKVGIIAEIKRKSPSKGVFKENLSVEELSISYMQAGASALSVLTDNEFFGGSNDDLKTARKFNFCPILRKDFIIDEYQVHEAKAIGADVILLIAAALSAVEVKNLSQVAHSIGLEVLLEIHSKEELEDLDLSSIDLIGVNNRNLNTFKVSIDTALELADLIPDTFIKVAESGISSAEAVLKLQSAGYQGFLIGEAFMSSSDPAKACYNLVKSISGRKQ